MDFFELFEKIDESKILPIAHTDIDRWLKSVDGLAKDLQDLKRAREKAWRQPKKKPLIKNIDKNIDKNKDEKNKDEKDEKEKEELIDDKLNKTKSDNTAQNQLKSKVGKINGDIKKKSGKIKD